MFGTLMILLAAQTLTACGSAMTGTPAPVSPTTATPSAASPPIGVTLDADMAQVLRTIDLDAR